MPNLFGYKKKINNNLLHFRRYEFYLFSYFIFLFIILFIFIYFFFSLGVIIDRSSDIEITATSALQSSQKGRITQIVWVPCYNKIGKDGKIISLTAETPTTNLTRQFITSSEDGTVAFWDLKSVFCPLKYIKNIWGEKNQNIPNKIQIFNYNQN